MVLDLVGLEVFGLKGNPFCPVCRRGKIRSTVVMSDSGLRLQSWLEILKVDSWGECLLFEGDSTHRAELT